MARKGGITSKFYRETRGLKISGGQTVKSGTMLTRQGDHWKPGRNVNGLMHLTAACEGEVYFSKKRGKYTKVITLINIKPLPQKSKKKE